MDKAVTRMIKEISSILEGRVYGAWLYGSVVFDDFRPGWSDIDFVMLVNEPISEKQAERLLMLRQNMLKKEPGNMYYRCFEGVIANVNEYRSQAFQRLVYWGTSGQRITDRYTPDPFSLFELAKYGKRVYGDKEWILSAPDNEELAAAVREHYDCIRKYAVETDESIYSCGWLLDIARCIYTLRNGDVISKTQAGLWAIGEHLFSDEAPLRKTIEIRQNPLLYKDRKEIRQWLKGLGPVVQSYADVLEQELINV